MKRKVWSSIVAVPYCFSRSFIKVQGHTGQKIADFDPNWTFLDCKCSLNSPWLWNDAQSLMYYRRCALLFFKVIHQISRSGGQKKSPILTRIERFRIVIPVSIHWWLWNDAQSLTLYRRRVLLVFQVIHQIPRSHICTWQKISRFRPEFSVSRLKLQFEFTDGF